MRNIYDIVVIGGGLSGCACALTAARHGKKVLLVERRPALGWESTWACRLDFSGNAGPVARSIIEVIGKAGGLRQNRADAPILEMALDRLADENGVAVLLYSYPVKLIFDGDTASGVVIGHKNGEQVVKARVIVDATEEALLWRQTAPFRNQPPKRSMESKYVLFFNHCKPAIKLPAAASNGIMLYPSVWKNEVLAEFSVDQNDVLAAKRMVPPVIKLIRAEIPQLKDALVSHCANETFPNEPLINFSHAGIEHPDIRNFFASGIWAAPAANTPVGRLNLGEEAGKVAARCKGARLFPDEIAAGSVLRPPDESAADVIVAGGGTGGAIAGISAGREGAKTTLIEASPILGGIGTGGAISGYYYGIRGGIQDEVDERVANMTPLFFGKWKMSPRHFHPEVKKIVLQQMLEEAHVELHLNTVITGVVCRDSAQRARAPVATTALAGRQARDRLPTGVIAVNPWGAALYNAEAFVDSTGDGDLAVMAGAPFQIGRERDNLTHAFSQPCGYLAEETGNLAFTNVDAGYVDPTDTADLTRGRRLGIKGLWRPEFDEKNRRLYIAPLIGLRQSRQILGEYQLSLADEIFGRRFDDAVSYMESHYDNHGWDYENDSDQAALWVWALGNYSRPFRCEVPFRCMLPKKVDRLLLACRALSATYDAHMAFRMQNDMQRIGEVAGVAAAMCAQNGISPKAIDIKELQSILKQRGILDDKYRPKPALLANAARELPASAALADEKINELVWTSAFDRRSENALALRGMLNSAKADVRFKASAALAFLGSQDGVNELIKNVVDRNQEKIEGRKITPMWQAAITFLGMARDARSLPPLLNVLKDKSAGLDTLIAVLRALERIGADSAIPAISAFLKRNDLPIERVLQTSCNAAPVVDDARWQLELAAAETIIKLGGPPDNARRIIKPHLADKRAYVRRYANKLADLLCPGKYHQQPQIAECPGLSGRRPNDDPGQRQPGRLPAYSAARQGAR